jgi:hypothetical protein
MDASRDSVLQAPRSRISMRYADNKHAGNESVRLVAVAGIYNKKNNNNDDNDNNDNNDNNNNNNNNNNSSSSSSNNNASYADKSRDRPKEKEMRT